VRPVTAFLVVALACATLLSSGPGLSQAEYDKTDAQRFSKFRSATVSYEKALKLLSKKDRDGALKALAACFEQEPEYPEGRFLMARLLYAEKEYTRALGEIILATSGHEKTADLREKMQWDRRKAISERVRGKDTAISEQTGRMATLPMDQRSMVEMEINRLQQEKAVLERELEDTNRGPLLVPARFSSLHGNILLRLDRLPEAVKQYEEALKAEPGFGEAANNLASVYHSAGQHQKALDVATEAQKRGATLHPELVKSIESALAKAKQPPGP
jgi:tetratricopeptide (TPR) repeat protein